MKSSADFTQPLGIFHMTTLAGRIAFLLSQRDAVEKWVGQYDAELLTKWLRAELGDERRLEEWVEGARVVARQPVLHVVSGNTPHAAFQSVFRAILLGCGSWVKIPSAGLPEFEEWIAAAGLDGWVDTRRELPEEWRKPEVAVIYGGSRTIGFFRGWLAPGTRLVEHGPKLGAAFVFAPRKGLARQLAEDVMRYGQRGCLSVQMVYLKGAAEGFCEELAAAMRDYVEQNGAAAADLTEAGALRNERELARFRIANGAPLKMWESEGSIAWTVLLDGDAKLRAGPLGGFVRVVPMPDEISRASLGDEADHLSTVVVEPLSEAGRLERLSPPRICGAGRAQEPGIFWHPDGEMPLAGLVRWRDLG
jgi:hypothetical protein